MDPNGQLHRRLLKDIAELQQDGYPNVYLYVNDTNIRTACLILTPEHEQALHLTIKFSDHYPLRAPEVTIQSDIRHPNVFGNCICASILNTTEGWTPAYTLKAVAIQLLSFFSSENIEQSDGGEEELNLSTYRRRKYGLEYTNDGYLEAMIEYRHECECCKFGPSWVVPQREYDDSKRLSETQTARPLPAKSLMYQFPDEIALEVLQYLSIRDIRNFGRAVPGVRKLVQSYDFVRIRELHCFCLKKSFRHTKLGIGVSIAGSGKRAVFRSEFDLLSNEAYNLLHVRKSIHGVPFEKWLPLPLSERHWNRVKINARHAIEGLHKAAHMRGEGHVEVLFHFMNSIVVQFSSTVGNNRELDRRSTLAHASEKAVESYFAVFHLLLCLATEDRSIIQQANTKVSRFLRGPRTKTHFPDLGHLLVAALISDDGLTEDLIFHIIKEAILRNVVWMLDEKGAGMAELAYLEPSDTSEYRLWATFHASKTSYRLLMFLKLFNSAARTPGKSLAQLRADLFTTHSAPPPGTAEVMARKIKQIHAIDSFPAFFAAMGLNAASLPTKEQFTAFLRRTILESVEVGYSVMQMTQSQLFMIRRAREPHVQARADVKVTDDLRRWYESGEKWYANGWNGRPSFFPRGNDLRGSRGGARGGNLGGRLGRGRGRDA